MVREGGNLTGLLMRTVMGGNVEKHWSKGKKRKAKKSGGRKEGINTDGGGSH